MYKFKATQRSKPRRLATTADDGAQQCLQQWEHKGAPVRCFQPAGHEGAHHGRIEVA